MDKDTFRSFSVHAMAQAEVERQAAVGWLA